MGVGDFFVQIPPQLFLMTCGSGILLIVAVSIIIWRRSSHNNKRARTEPAPDIATLTDQNRAEGSTVTDRIIGVFSRIGKAVYSFFFYTEEEKAQMTQQTSTAESPMLTHAAPPDTIEVMRIWRDVIDGSLVIQIGGESYRTMGDIRAADEERRFMAILRDLARIAKDLPPAPPESLMPEAVAPPAAPAPSQSTEAEIPPVSPPPAPENFAPPPEPAPPPGPATQARPEAAPAPARQPVMPPPSFQAQPSRTGEDDAEPIGTFFDNVRKAIRTGGKSAQAAPNPEPLSIAEQIEDMLQYRLTLTSDFVGRNIHVRQGIHGSVLIEVDGAFFESVDDVTDEEAREFIRGIIQDWQDQQ